MGLFTHCVDSPEDIDCVLDVVYLHQYFNTPSMQGSTRSYELARRLVDRGHTVRMVTSWREADDHTDCFVTNENGIEVHWLPIPYGNELSYRQRLQAFFGFAVGAARLASRLPGDVVFATSTPLTVALPGAWAAWRGGRPMVFEVRDLWPEMPIAIGALRNPLAIWAARRLERFAYRRSRRVVALSPGMADGVAATGYPRECITVIPNSCDFDRFDPDPGAGKAFRSAHPELGAGPIVLYAGTIGRINAVEYMVELAAACRTRLPDARFVVLGAGSEATKVLTCAEELGVLGNNFFFYGQVPKAEVGHAFAAASVVTSWVVELPQCEKNSANKFFDGLAAGRAIAINHGGWQAELLRESGAGLVLSRDVSVAADELLEWLTDPERLAEAGKQARKLGEARFSRDQLALDLERTLLAALGP